MSTPELTPTTRSAIEKALDTVGAYGFLTDSERAALHALRDACPEPRWLPTGDGVAERTDADGNQCIYYVRSGEVGAQLRTDGTLRFPFDPAELRVTWKPYVHEVTPEQITRAASAAICFESTLRAALPHLGCREVTR